MSVLARILELFRENNHSLNQLVCDYAEAKNTAALHPLYLGTRCQNLHWGMGAFDISSIEEDKDKKMDIDLRKQAEKLTKGLCNADGSSTIMIHSFLIQATYKQWFFYNIDFGRKI